MVSPNLDPICPLPLAQWRPVELNTAAELKWPEVLSSMMPLTVMVSSALDNAERTIKLLTEQYPDQLMREHHG